VAYQKPKVKHLLELDGLSGVEYDVRLCSFCLTIDGKLQDYEAWWKELDNDVYSECIDFLKQHLPKKKKGEADPLASKS